MTNRQLSIIALKVFALFIAVEFAVALGSSGFRFGASLQGFFEPFTAKALAGAFALIGLIPLALSFFIWRFATRMATNSSDGASPAAISDYPLLLALLGVYFVVSALPLLFSSVGYVVGQLSARSDYFQGLRETDVQFPIADFLYCGGLLIQMGAGLVLILRPSDVIGRLRAAAK
jgi:hypothetical protein